jgi:RHS repeat-associated protein
MKWPRQETPPSSPSSHPAAPKPPVTPTPPTVKPPPDTGWEASINLLRYTGAFTDPGTNFTKLGPRYYNTTQSRFTQEDHITRLAKRQAKARAELDAYVAGHHLRELREAVGKTQTELAKVLGVSQSRSHRSRTARSRPWSLRHCGPMRSRWADIWT